MTETMTPGEVLAALQEFVPYAQKHPLSRKGYVVGMRRKNKRDELDEVQTYLYAASVRTAVSAMIAERNAAMDICRKLAALRDGLDNSNSSAEEMAARLAHKAAALAACRGL